MAQLFFRISRRFPELKLKLRQAGMKDTPEDFVKKTILSSFYMTTGIVLLFASILAKFKPLFYGLLISTPILFVVFFFYFIKLPDVKILRHKREINQEIIYAGRFLIVELKSGVLLYDALKNVSKSFKTIGKYFRDIVTAVDMGTTLEDALVDAIEYTPSEDLRRVLWQTLNALNTGADVAESLNAVVDQITKKQAIEINQYAKKLNPLAMFYMMIAVIMPSLGITLLVVLSSFFPIDLDLLILLIIAVVFGIMQMSFLAIIKSSRPAVGI
jgi:pilus assembly protein TadC